MTGRAIPLRGSPGPGGPGAEGRAKALANRQMFAHIALRYDLMNRLMSWGRDSVWRRAAAEMAGARPGSLTLDMATGTGDLAFAVAARGGQVVGIDICQPMIALGRRKAQQRGLERRAVFALGDGLSLPFAAGTFDAAVTAFALRNVADVKAALGELHRVLKPGGRLACIETLPAPQKGLRLLHLTYLGIVVPLLARVITGNSQAYLYLRDSVRSFYNAQDLRALLEEVGFGQVHYRFYHFRSVAIHTGIK